MRSVCGAPRLAAATHLLTTFQFGVASMIDYLHICVGVRLTDLLQSVTNVSGRLQKIRE